MPLAERTLDANLVVGGIVSPWPIGERIASTYRKHLFGDATLSQTCRVSHCGDALRIVIDATHVQSGALWRFMKQDTDDWRVGEVRSLRVRCSLFIPRDFLDKRIHHIAQCFDLE